MLAIDYSLSEACKSCPAAVGGYVKLLRVGPEILRK